MFIRKYWLPLSVFLIAIVGVGLYVLQTQPPKPPIQIITPVEVEKKPKPPPPGETAESGYWHGDEWHGEPHAPVEVSESEVSADGQGVPDVLAAPVVAEPANTQIDAATLESAERRLKDPEVSKAWGEWSRKYRELNQEYLRVSGEGTAALPSTKEEQERFKNDEQYRREVRRKHNESLHKSAKIYGMMKAHEKENPLLQ